MNIAKYRSWDTHFKLRSCCFIWLFYLGTADPALPPSLETVALLADLYDRELVGTIGWAKQVGYTQLPLV